MSTNPSKKLNLQDILENADFEPDPGSFIYFGPKPKPVTFSKFKKSIEEAVEIQLKIEKKSIVEISNYCGVGIVVSLTIDPTIF